MKAPERIETERLVLRRPLAADAEAILARYAADPEVTRFLAWPTHRSLADTRTFLDSSDVEWARWPAGPYLVESRRAGTLLGSTGLAFETAQRAATGYVFARDVWGKGYATEALRAMVGVAADLGVHRLEALCYPEHEASHHVLEKCGFRREGLLERHSEFPNLRPGEALDVVSYGRSFE